MAKIDKIAENMKYHKFFYEYEIYNFWTPFYFVHLISSNILCMSTEGNFTRLLFSDIDSDTDN